MWPQRCAEEAGREEGAVGGETERRGGDHGVAAAEGVDGDSGEGGNVLGVDLAPPFGAESAKPGGDRRR